MKHTVTIIGRITKEPEMRYTPNGDAITALSVAVDRHGKEGGKWVKKTIWFRVNLFGKQAEAINEFQNVVGAVSEFSGELGFDPETGGPRIWVDKDGKPRASFELRAAGFTFIGQTAKRETAAAPVTENEE